MRNTSYEESQAQFADEIDAAIEDDLQATGRHGLAAHVRRERYARRAQMTGIREYRNGRATGSWSAAARARQPAPARGDLEDLLMRTRLLELGG